MVFFFTSSCGRQLYMGRDKYENETLIAHGWEEDIWLHVDDLSSAHVYLRQSPGETLDSISESLLLEMATLVKANSIEGCKKNHVSVVYTRWKNLKKTANMVDGQVSYHRPENVRRLTNIEKNNAIVKALEKTRREEDSGDWAKRKSDHLDKLRRTEKLKRLKDAKDQKALDKENLAKKEAYSYERVFEMGEGKKASEMGGTADDSAATEFEDDFF